MPIYDTPNLTSGIDDAIVDVAQTVDAFVPMVLFFIYGLVFIGGMISQRNKTGTFDAPLWSTLGSIATLMVALSMTLVADLINLATLSIVVTFTILNGIWFFMSGHRNEV